MCNELPSKDYSLTLNEDLKNYLSDLIDTSKTLEEVANHCLASYNNSLEQTVNVTAQALGCLSYKTNQIAETFLQLLDQQNIKLNNLKTKVTHLDMKVKINHERSARLSIGKNTLPKEFICPPKIREPILEINDNYRRKEIDFTLLDNIGHGAKDAQLGGSTVASSNFSALSSSSGTGFNTQSPNVPLVQSSRGGSFSMNTVFDYNSQYIRKMAGFPMNSNTTNMYRSPGPVLQKVQIPFVSPNYCGAVNIPSTVRNDLPATQLITHHSNSINTDQSFGAVPIQGKLLHSSSVLPSTKMPFSPVDDNTKTFSNYFGISSITSPPSPYTSGTINNQVDNTPTMRYDELPPPPPPPSFVPHCDTQVMTPRSSMFDQSSVNYSNSVRTSVNSDLQRISSNTITAVECSEQMMQKSQDDPFWVPDQYVCQVVTLYPYQRNNDDELDFQENETIFVVDKNEDGWWHGVMSSGTGMFPSNYVQKMN